MSNTCVRACTHVQVRMCGCASVSTRHQIHPPTQLPTHTTMRQCQPGTHPPTPLRVSVGQAPTHPPTQLTTTHPPNYNPPPTCSASIKALWGSFSSNQQADLCVCARVEGCMCMCVCMCMCMRMRICMYVCMCARARACRCAHTCMCVCVCVCVCAGLPVAPEDGVGPVEGDCRRVGSHSLLVVFGLVGLIAL